MRSGASWLLPAPGILQIHLRSSLCFSLCVSSRKPPWLSPPVAVKMRFIQHTVLRFSLVNIYREVWLSSLEWGPLKAVSPLQLRVPERRDMSAPPQTEASMSLSASDSAGARPGAAQHHMPVCVRARLCVCVLGGGVVKPSSLSAFASCPTPCLTPPSCRGLGG